MSAFAAEWQSRGKHDYFTTRASQCFSTPTGPSSVDVWMNTASQIESPKDQSPVNHNRVETCQRSSGVLSARTFSSRVVKDDELGQLSEILRTSGFTVFFIRQRNSLSRLNVSQQLFDAVCQSCGISTNIRDYIACFGTQNGQLEISPPAMYYHLSRRDHFQQPSALECIYVLRFVEPNNRTYGNPWSIRQSGVYNYCNRKDASVVWLFVSLSSTAEAELQRWRTSTSNLPDTGPFDIHYMLFDLAISGWRIYITYLADQIRQQVDRAVVSEFETEGVTVTRLEERQYLKQLEDNVTDLSSALDFMLENIDTVMRCYQSFVAQPPQHKAPDGEGTDNVDAIFKGFGDRRRDLLRFGSQVQALRRKVDSASSLVSNILDLNNGNALKALALESRVENANMALLTQKSVQDAATVKVLTIVTLVYLPLTVVTNFFSTQFVNTAEGENGTFLLSIVPQVWILFAVSVPLTIGTIYIWWLFAQKEIRGKFPDGWKRIVQRVKPASEGIGQPATISTID